MQRRKLEPLRCHVTSPKRCSRQIEQPKSSVSNAQRRHGLEKVIPQRQWDSPAEAQSNGFSYVEQCPYKYFRRTWGTDVVAPICSTSSARKTVSSKLALDLYKNLSQKSNKREDIKEKEERGRGGKQKKWEEMERGKRRRKRQKRTPTRKLPIYTQAFR